MLVSAAILQRSAHAVLSSPNGGRVIRSVLQKVNDMTINEARHAQVRNKLAQAPKPDPRVETLVNEVIGRVADKWTMIVIDVLAEHGELRFTQLARLVNGISQKMLTQTLREMEREGLVIRTVHPVVPPKVEYRLTDLGLGLGAAFCGVWVWAEENLETIERARAAYDQLANKTP